MRGSKLVSDFMHLEMREGYGSGLTQLLLLGSTPVCHQNASAVGSAVRPSAEESCYHIFVVELLSATHS